MRLKRIVCLVLVGVMCMSTTVYAQEYEYDRLNRVTKVIYEDGSYVTYEYDANGNITKTKVYDATPEMVETTSPVESSKPTVTAQPTKKPQPTTTVQPTKSPQPTTTVQPTDTLEPITTVQPLQSLEPTETGKDEEVEIIEKVNKIKKEIEKIANVVMKIRAEIDKKLEEMQKAGIVDDGSSGSNSNGDDYTTVLKLIERIIRGLQDLIQSL